jgi:large subunit ribosomal protein L30
VPSIKITQVRSPVSRQKDQGRTLKALGLRRISDSVEHKAAPEIHGMVAKVAHLVEVEEIEESK